MTHERSHLGEKELITIGVVWGIAVVIGLVLLFNHQTASGSVGNPSIRWPSRSRIVPSGDRVHLVMVAHPRCPCSRASLESLARIMAHAQNRANASVLFLKPTAAPSGWEKTDLWRSAAAIPSVEAICDEGGHEAARFGTETSGHVLLYDRNGQRIFNGGITAGRGHHGDNAGLVHCIAFINGEQTDPRDAPVFGCSLFAPSMRDVEGEDTCRKTK